MAYNVHITSKAEKDLDDIVTYISEELKNPKAASRILEEFLEEKLFHLPTVCVLKIWAIYFCKSLIKLVIFLICI